MASHACQHLTDETLSIAAEYGVNVAVMPCCQKDHDGWWKALTKCLVKSDGSNVPSSLSIGVIMDLLAAGKMMAWDAGAKAGVQYRVKMKLMDETISPMQNRMIMCKAITRPSVDFGVSGGRGDIENSGYRKKELAHEKLTRAYRRAHRQSKGRANKKDSSTASCGAENCEGNVIQFGTPRWYIPSLMAGFCIGAAFSLVLTSQLRKK